MPTRPAAPRWKTGMREVAPRVFAYLQATGETGISNAGLVVGPDGAVAIDALMVPSMTRRLLAAIRKTTRKKIGALVNTHHHLDHTGGNRLFRGATIIASERCRAELAPGFPPVPLLQRFMPRFAREFPLLRMALPTVTFEDRLVIHDGTREIHLWHPRTPAHTSGAATRNSGTRRSCRWTFRRCWTVWRACAEPPRVTPVYEHGRCLPRASSRASPARRRTPRCAPAPASAGWAQRRRRLPRRDPVHARLERDDVTDHDQCRRGEPRRRRPFHDVGQRADDGLLLRCRALANEGDRRLRAAPVGHEVGDDAGQAPQSHDDHQRVDRRRQPGPVDARPHLAAVLVAGDDRDRRRHAAMRQRDAGIGRRADHRAHAGHDLERNAVGGQRLGFLAAAPEHEGIAPFQPHHAPPRAGMRDEQRVDRVLGQRVLAGRLAREDAERPSRRQGEQARIDQSVVHHDVGPTQRLAPAERQQPGIAGPGADQMNAPGGHFTWGAPRWPPTPPEARSAPGNPGRSSIRRAHLFTWGAPRWPPTLPNVRSAPGNPWRSSTTRLRPRCNARGAPGRSSVACAHLFTWGAPRWPPTPPSARSAPGNPWRSSITGALIVRPAGP